MSRTKWALSGHPSMEFIGASWARTQECDEPGACWLVPWTSALLSVVAQISTRVTKCKLHFRHVLKKLNIKSPGYTHRNCSGSNCACCCYLLQEMKGKKHYSFNRVVPSNLKAAFSKAIILALHWRSVLVQLLDWGNLLWHTYGTSICIP